ncbi:hypothetical protein [Streptomyces arenae]|uniref:hypothetical protein n=1 Tax=Streptomyces arenae TaxID=29301 RepID=UPI0026592A86|nr:hypothetical protein [Streptomyces arenae]MCG7206298.1 hypothetical protein [Streptomyces arenae]
MGVFARLLGKKSKATEEPGAEVTAGVEPAGPEVENTAENTAENATESAARETAEATAAKGSGSTEGDAGGHSDGSDADGSLADGGHGGVDARTEPEPEPADAVTADESTEIPKQQSAREAADNEAGENART